MGFFNRKAMAEAPKRRRIRKVKTAEEKLNDKAKQWAMDLAEQDVNFKLKLIAAKTGVALEEKGDPVQNAVRRAHAAAIQAAADQYMKDPENLNKILEEHRDEIFGSPRGDYDEEGGEYLPEGPIEHLTNELRQMGELRELMRQEFGGQGSSWLDALKDPKVLPLLLAILGRATNTPGVDAIMGQGNGMEPKVYVIIDGQPRMVTEGQFQELQAQGKIKPVGFIETKAGPRTEPALPESPEPPPPVQGQRRKVTVGYLSNLMGKPPGTLVNDLSAMMEKAPSEFVDELDDKVQKRDMQSVALMGFLQSQTPDSIMSVLGGYDYDESLQPYIDQLKSDHGRLWLKEVLGIIAEGASDDGA